MTDRAYAGLRMAARAGSPDPENPENEPEDEKVKGGKKKDDHMTEEEHKAALAEAEAKAQAKGFAEANARVAAVMASEHYAGREALAQKLLGNAKLSADEIIETLSAAEKKAPAAAAELSDEEKRKAAEEGGRAEMQAALKETANSGVDAGTAPKKDAAEASAAVWDKAIGKLTPNKAG